MVLLLQLREPWPYHCHLKQRCGFGMYGRSLSVMCQTSTVPSSMLDVNASTKCFVSISLFSRLIFIIYTYVTSWSFS